MKLAMLFIAVFLLETFIVLASRSPREIDMHYSELSKLRNCNNETEWILPKSNLTSEADMEEMIESFGV